MDTCSSGRIWVFEIEANLNSDTCFSLPQRPVHPLHWRESVCHGAVLAQVHDGKDWAICYASKSLKSTNKVLRDTPRAASPCNFHTSYPLRSVWSKVQNSSWSYRTSMAIQFQWSRWTNHKMVKNACTYWLRSGSWTRQTHRSCRWVVVHSTELDQGNESNLPSTSPPIEVPRLASAINNYQEVIGNSTDSIAHCVSTDFKIAAGIVQHFQRKRPTNYPSDLDHSYTPLWPQWLPETHRYLYHLVMKQKYFNKPTFSTLRSSLQKMRTHAESNSFFKSSMACIGMGLDHLDWDKVKLLIRETFRSSPVQVVVYILPDPKTKQGDIPVENEPTSKFAQAQEADELVEHERRWVRQKQILRKTTFEASLDWDGKRSTNWVVITSRMVFFVVNLSPRTFAQLIFSKPFVRRCSLK